MESSGGKDTNSSRKKIFENPSAAARVGFPLPEYLAFFYIIFGYPLNGTSTPDQQGEENTDHNNHEGGKSAKSTSSPCSSTSNSSENNQSSSANLSPTSAPSTSKTTGSGGNGDGDERQEKKCLPADKPDVTLEERKLFLDEAEELKQPGTKLMEAASPPQISCPPHAVANGLSKATQQRRDPISPTGQNGEKAYSACSCESHMRTSSGNYPKDYKAQHRLSEPPASRQCDFPQECNDFNQSSTSIPQTVPTRRHTQSQMMKIRKMEDALRDSTETALPLRFRRATANDMNTVSKFIRSISFANAAHNKQTETRTAIAAVKKSPESEGCADVPGSSIKENHEADGQRDNVNPNIRRLPPEHRVPLDQSGLPLDFGNKPSKESECEQDQENLQEQTTNGNGQDGDVTQRLIQTSSTRPKKLEEVHSLQPSQESPKKVQTREASERIGDIADSQKRNEANIGDMNKTWNQQQNEEPSGNVTKPKVPPNIPPSNAENKLIESVNTGGCHPVNGIEGMGEALTSPVSALQEVAKQNSLLQTSGRNFLGGDEVEPGRMLRQDILVQKLVENREDAASFIRGERDLDTGEQDSNDAENDTQRSGAETVPQEIEAIMDIVARDPAENAEQDVPSFLEGAEQADPDISKENSDDAGDHTPRSVTETAPHQFEPIVENETKTATDDYAVDDVDHEKGRPPNPGKSLENSVTRNTVGPYRVAVSQEDIEYEADSEAKTTINGNAIDDQDVEEGTSSNPRQVLVTSIASNAEGGIDSLDGEHEDMKANKEAETAINHNAIDDDGPRKGRPPNHGNNFEKSLAKNQCRPCCVAVEHEDTEANQNLVESASVDRSSLSDGSECGEMDALCEKKSFELGQFTEDSHCDDSAQIFQDDLAEGPACGGYHCRMNLVPRLDRVS